jgi:hypothetical protein
VRAQAWIALGDTFVSQDSTNKLNDYRYALTAYEQVPSLCPSNEMTALALGQKASCLLQCAQSPQDYVAVSNAFRQVIEEPHADGKVRTIATIGLGVTLEKLAQSTNGDERAEFLNLALSQYLDAMIGKGLREGEKPDSFWTRDAGIRAARLAESLDPVLQYGRAPRDYLAVTNALRQIIEASHTDGRGRTIAIIGVGVILEQLAQLTNGDERVELLNLALSQYLDALYGKALHEGEKPDSFWTRDAGFRAARLAESLNQFRQAANVLQWLQDQFPALRLQNRIDGLRAKELESAQKN